MLKRTSPGPMSNKTGGKAKDSVTDKARDNIGTEGVTQGELPTEGGQYSFLPSEESYMGRSGDAKEKAGQIGMSTNKDSAATYDFLPKSLSDKNDTKGK